MDGHILYRVIYKADILRSEAKTAYLPRITRKAPKNLLDVANSDDVFGTGTV